MNKVLIKIPIYLGLAVFVISILAASIKIGERSFVFNGRLKADQNEAVLSLEFSSPNIISIAVVSEQEVSGADLAVKYNSDNMEILPSTLSGRSGFITSGGDLDEENGEYFFSAVNNGSLNKSGIIASFRISGNSDSENQNLGNINIQFDSGKTRIYSEQLEIIPVTLHNLNIDAK